MKKSRLILMIFLIILLFNSTFVIAEKTPVKEFNEGAKEGERFGYIEGINRALQLYKEGNKEGKQPTYAKPNYSEVQNKYTEYLIGKPENYKTGFVNGFYIGHMAGFNEIVDSKKSSAIVDKSSQVNYGDALGLIYGEIAAYKDYNKGNKSNWSKAIPDNTKIIKLFDLSMESSSYKACFLKEFKNSFQEGYKQGYENSLLEEKKISSETGISHGETIGAYLGEIYGIKDYQGNKKMNYNISIPLSSTIIKEYSLNMDDLKYQEAFLEGFKRAFKQSYNKGYRAANVEEKSLEDSTGYNNGNNIGMIKGQILANEDYILDKPSNWKRHSVSDMELMKDYKLLYQSNGYRKSFINGYWKGFSGAYKNIYRNLNLSEASIAIIMREVTTKGGNFYSGDNKVCIEIHKGTYYNDIVLTMDTLLNNEYPSDKNYIKASNVYGIKVTNKSNDFNTNIPIYLSFEYYGGKDGGIYKLINNKWEYINSEIKDEKISVKINPNTLNNNENIYAVFIDNAIPLLYDIRAHWAKDEIYTYIKRGILTGYSDNTFKPNNNITRGEFSSLINKVYEKEITYNKNHINDFDKSKLNEFISYKEVEEIMKRLLKDNKFNWDNIANSMLYDKKTRSKSKDNIYNKITRAECVYMLYNLNEWRY